MKNVLYHGSKVQNLKELAPFEKLHTGNFVYAIDNKEAAILFSANYHILKVMLSYKILENGEKKFSLMERFPGAFNDYKLPISVYTINNKGFETFDNAWGGELRNPNIIKVLKEEKYASAYDEMWRLHNEGKITLYNFENRPDNWPKDNCNMICTALLCYLTGGDESYISDFKKLYPQFSELMDKLIPYIKTLNKESQLAFVNSIYDKQAKQLRYDIINSVKTENLN